jgi:ribosomal protein S18 acetylase RimI-like enzyme
MIKSLTLNDIDQVARIHIIELKGFLPELGLPFLKKFYKESLNIPEMFTYVEKNNEQVIGFVSGITTAKGLYKKIIFNDLGWFILFFMNYVSTHPNKIITIIQTLLYPGFTEDDPELLTIAVSSASQRRGVGRKLFNKVVKEFQKMKIREFKISVYDKLQANGFYRKIGCRLDKTFIFLGEKMHYYRFRS